MTQRPSIHRTSHPGFRDRNSAKANQKHSAPWVSGRCGLASSAGSENRIYVHHASICQCPQVLLELDMLSSAGWNMLDFNFPRFKPTHASFVDARTATHYSAVAHGRFRVIFGAQGLGSILTNPPLELTAPRAGSQPIASMIFHCTLLRYSDPTNTDTTMQIKSSQNRSSHLEYEKSGGRLPEWSSSIRPGGRLS
ncbi:hypothetical protein BD779DRAFT_1124869 [Infundibulicybe gibba]|nr:hypothetical protein BD779DRAFT_1124869 [Infundibulicybe gibba]